MESVGAKEEPSRLTGTPTLPFIEGFLKVRSLRDDIMGGGQSTSSLEVPLPHGDTRLAQFLQGPWSDRRVPYMTGSVQMPPRVPCPQSQGREK